MSEVAGPAPPDFTASGLSLEQRAALIAAYPPAPGIEVADPAYIASLSVSPSLPDPPLPPPVKVKAPPRRSGTSRPACVVWLLSVSHYCMWCGLGGWGKAGRSAKTWEHVRPRSLGGTNASRNAGVAHGGCNSSRPAYDEARDTEVHLRWLAMTLAGFDDEELRRHAFAWFLEHPYRVAARARRLAMREEVRAAAARSVGPAG